MLCKSLIPVVLFASFFGGGVARAEALRLDDDLVLGTAETIVAHADWTKQTTVAPMSLFDLGPAATNGPPPAAGLSGIGLGLQLGFPTAITLKIGAAQRDGLVFGLGAGFGYNGFAPWFSLTGEYQLHLVTLVSNPSLSLTFYFSPGLWLALSPYGNAGYFGFYNRPYFNNFPLALGVRASFGLSMLFTAAPIELYLELTPAIFVFPGFDPGVGWSLGFRYYF